MNRQSPKVDLYLKMLVRSLIAALICTIVPGRTLSAEEGANPLSRGPQALLAALPQTVASNLPEPPADGDDTGDSLAAYLEELSTKLGAADRDLPLEWKADFYEWLIWRYHFTPYRQVITSIELPEVAGERPLWLAGRDDATWNGALLAALSYKYAATEDAETLAHIAELLQGMHFFFEVTGQPGYAARCVVYENAPPREEMTDYVAPDGTRYRYMYGPAKGTYNQLAGGYATMMMYVFDDLPPEVQRIARDDVTDMVLHLIDHHYKLTDRNGERSPYGDMTPVFASVGVPFNAQVAYQIVALGRYFAGGDAAGKARIQDAFRDLRDKEHVYYEHPWRNIVQPQRIGGSPFVKGMNDRNHVTNAAFVSLAMDIHASRTAGGPLDSDFIYRMGRTGYHSMAFLDGQHNALCSFMWAALLTDKEAFDLIIKRKENSARALMERNLLDGVEHLRRFPLDRFIYKGADRLAEHPVWIDQYRPDAYHWKNDSHGVFTRTGPRTSRLISAIDYLHAYWLFRAHQLNQHPMVQQAHGPVL